MLIYEDLTPEEQAIEQLSNGPLWRDYKEYREEEENGNLFMEELLEDIISDMPNLERAEQQPKEYEYEYEYKYETQM